MKSLFLSFFLVLSVGTYAQVRTSGNITTNTIWQSDTIFLTGDVTVNNGVTLTIRPNVKVIAEGYFKIDVKGSLKAIGTSNQFIEFRRSDTLGFWDTTHTRGGWGGLHFENISPQNDSSILRFCRVRFGKAVGPTRRDRSGGGILIDSCDKISFENTEISNNLAQYTGGGICILNDSKVKMSRMLIKNNRSFLYAGGSACYDRSSLMLSNSLIIENMAGFYNLDGSPSGVCGGTYFSNGFTDELSVVSQNIIANNRSIGGAGLYESCRQIHVISNIIANNDGLIYEPWGVPLGGGGIYNGTQMGLGMYINNTIVNNQEAGISVLANDLTIQNNIIKGNVREVTGRSVHDVYNGWNNGVSPVRNRNNNVTGDFVLYNPRNFNRQSLFVRPSASYGMFGNGYEADWRLLSNSPEVDAGTLDFLPPNLVGERDVYGNPRIVNNRIDVGAAEFQTTNFVPVVEKIEDIKIYPNPFSGQLWLDLSKQTGVYKCLMTNAIGQIVWSTDLKNDLNLIETDQFLNGNYVLSILNAQNQVVYSAKLVRVQ